MLAEAAWILAFLKLFFFLPLVGVAGTVLHQSIPSCFGSCSKAWHTIRYGPQQGCSKRAGSRSMWCSSAAGVRQHLARVTSQAGHRRCHRPRMSSTG